MENKNNTCECGGCGWCTIKKVAVVLGAILIIFVAVKIVSEFKAISYIGKPAISQSVNVITVSGKGEVLATPDIANISFGVSEESLVVSDAQKKATDKTNAILAFLKKNGVEDKDVKTTSYNIYPRYEYAQMSGKQNLAAYVVSQNVQIKVRKIEDAGKLLAGLATAGATDISGLSFTNDKRDDLVRDAREKAIKDAREQAEVLARSLGVDLGSITSFYEAYSGDPRPMYMSAKVSSMDSFGGAIPQIPAGENTITSNVTITYEIR